MAQLSLSLLGPVRMTLHGQAITGFAYNKAPALLAYLAVEADRAHHRSVLAAHLWPDLSESAARINLRQVLADLRRVIGEQPSLSKRIDAAPSWLLVSGELLQFNAAADHDLDLTTFNALFDACDRHPHHRLVTCAACMDRLRQAVALYRGDFLAQFPLPNSGAFEEWVHYWREQLHQRALHALKHLAAFYERRRSFQEAEDFTRRQLALDPLHEEVHRRLMRLLVLQGKRSAALEHYERCRRILRDELGVEPEAETTALFHQIRSDRRVISSAQAPFAHQGALQSRLPQPSTPLIGRERELTALATYLNDPTCRLVTLAGAPGIGKTRLALQAATNQQSTFVDGVLFVSLAMITDPALVAPCIARALRVVEINGRSAVERLTDFFSEQQVLLVLDNFEQVRAAAPMLVELLEAAPELRILVTSRAILQVRGERVLIVPPLKLPDLRHLPPHTALSQYDAVRLFIARACDVKPDFQLTDANGRAVATICHHLDGLPLAIELAAVRTKLLSPQALLARLPGRFKLLTGGAQDLPVRQQTLRSAIDWSYNLLTEAEQILFARLGAFVGGWTIEAAEAICNADGDLRIVVLDGLQSLLDKSLLQHMAPLDGVPRFMMLETIRAYALERLCERGELDTLHRHIAHYFLALVTTAEPALHGPEQEVWLLRLEAEAANLRSVLAWSLTAADGVEMGLRLAAALGPFWSLREAEHEGREWLERMLARPEAGRRTSARAKALYQAGEMAGKQHDFGAAHNLQAESLAISTALADKRGMAYASDGLGRLFACQRDLERAQALYTESLALFEEVGDRWGRARALIHLATTLSKQGNHDRALQLAGESLTLCRELGDRNAIAFVLTDLGWIKLACGDHDAAAALFAESLARYRALTAWGGFVWAMDSLGEVLLQRGDYAGAERLFEEHVTLCQNAGYTAGIAWVRGMLGYAALLQGNYVRAAAAYTNSLELYRALRQRGPLAWALFGLGEAVMWQGDLVRATQLFAESLALYREVEDSRGTIAARCRLGYVAILQGDYRVGYDRLVESLALRRTSDDKRDIALSLEGLAMAAVEQGNAERALHLAGAADALRKSISARLSGVERAKLELRLGQVRQAVASEASESAWMEGQAMSLEQAIAYALEDVDSAAGKS